MSYKPFKFNPIEDLNLDIPKKNIKSALEEAANYIREEMLSYIAEASSPVSGGKWVKGLTKEYAEKKSEESSSGIANLENTGSFLDTLDVSVNGKELVVSVAEEKEDIATGHLTGEYGKNSRVRPRQFMPQDGQKFKRDILSNLKTLLQEFEE